VTHNQNFTKTRSLTPLSAVCGYHGPLAKELFILCRPDTAAENISSQTISLYRTLSEALQQEGGSAKHVFLANICGLPGNSEAEAYRMFQSAEKSLQEERMSFRDVIRTWIHLRHIYDDYSALNRGRTRFYREMDLALMPASTGIEGNSPFPSQNMCLSLYAIEDGARKAQCMSAPTLNEAWMYGSDFSRGIKVAGENGIALFISGTASIDEEGHTVHTGNFEAQAERMLLNISTLLANQKSSWRDVVSAITYLKDPLDALRFNRILEQKGIPIFPNAIVRASVCRSELLCEMEAIAILAPR
jgi:2-iminobutanoate/2-iminopropanoate deaminase